MICTYRESDKSSLGFPHQFCMIYLLKDKICPKKFKLYLPASTHLKYFLVSQPDCTALGLFVLIPSCFNFSFLQYKQVVGSPSIK